MTLNTPLAPLVKQSRAVKNWMTAFQVLLGLGGLATLLGLLPLFLLVPVALSEVGSGGTVALAVGLLLLLLLTLAVFYGGLLWLLGWGKEWAEKMVAWLYPQQMPQVTADPRPRLQQLSDTLGRWLSGLAWSNVALLTLLAVGAALMPGLWQQLAGGDLLGDVGPTEQAFRDLSAQWGAVALGAPLVLTAVGTAVMWQAFMSLRRSLASATAVVQGQPPQPAAPTAGAAGWLKLWAGWVGLSSLLSLGLSLLLTSRAFELMAATDPELQGEDTAALTGVMTGMTALGYLPALALVLLFAAMLWTLAQFVTTLGAELSARGPEAALPPQRRSAGGVTAAEPLLSGPPQP